jgi:hypothetical protein
MLRIQMFGTFTTLLTGSPTITFTYQIGGSTLCTTTTAGIATTTTGTYWGAFPYIQDFCIQSIGSSGTIIGGTQVAGQNSAGGYPINSQMMTGNTSAQNVANNAPSAVTINTTTALAIDVKVQWVATTTSNSIQLLAAAIYLD